MDAVSRERRRILYLALIMAFVAFSILSIAIFFLYEATLRGQEQRLAEAVRSQARLIEQVAAMEHAEGRSDETVLTKTLAILHNSHSMYAGLGKTGEFTLGKRDEDTIVFLMAQRLGGKELPKPIPLGSEVGGPMQRALRGVSGPTIEKDYRGVMVVAASEPLVIVGRRFGIVAKIDLAEVREPFIKAVGIAVTSASLIILFGILVFLRVGGRFVSRIQESELGREMAEGSLSQSEERYRLLVENTADVVFLYRLLPERGFEYISPSVREVSGYSPDEHYADPDINLKIVHPDDHPLLEKIFSYGMEWQTPFIIRWVRKDGGTVWTEQRVTPVLDDAGVVVAVHGIARDVSVRVQTEAELKRTNTTLRILSDCNQTLITAASETELLESVCHSLVTIGGYAFAWVGYVGYGSTNVVVPVSHAGKEAGYLDLISFSLANLDRCEGPSCTAIKSGVPVVVDDIATDERFAKWREEALKRGFGSIAAVPLLFGGKVLGALNIYAAAPHAIEKPELDIFQELADDLAYGIHSIQMRAEKEKTVKALAESERRLREIMENVQLIAVMLDTKGRITFCNEYFLGLTGWSREDALWADWMGNFVPQTIRGELAAYCSALLEGKPGIVLTHENPIVTRSGEVRHILWSNTPIRDNEGKIIGITSIGEDITERKKAEAALVERLNMERMIAEISRLFAAGGDVELNRVLELMGREVGANRAYIFKVGADGKTMDNTHEWCKQGTESQIVSLQGLETAIFPWWMDKLKRNEDIVISDVEELTPAAYEEKAILKAQQIKAVVVVPIRNHGGRLTGYMGFDDTEKCRQWKPEDSRLLRIAGEMLSVHNERAESERLLRESEVLFRSVTESATDAIITMDVEEDIVTWNSSATRIFGYAEDEVMGAPLASLIPDLFSPKHIAGMVQRREKGGFSQRHLMAHTVELEGRDRQGKMFPIELSISSWETGEGVFHTAIIRDITRRKRQEAELKQSNEELSKAQKTLEDSQHLLLRSEKLASVGTLAAGVAHEILNPLNIIGTIVQLMLMEEKRKAERENLEEVMVQIQRAAKITNNLKLFARQRKMEIKPVDINAMFDHTIALIEHDLNLDNIVVDRDYANDLPLVRADEDQLSQIALNLLTNARDALKPKRKGTIAISTRPANGGVEIRFCDNGPGIPKEIVGKIFDPFFTTKEPGKGTGLGLSITYRIVEEHNGSIRVETIEGVGVCFIIFLPFGSGPVPPAENT